MEGDIPVLNRQEWILLLFYTVSCLAFRDDLQLPAVVKSGRVSCQSQPIWPLPSDLSNQLPAELLLTGCQLFV